MIEIKIAITAPAHWFVDIFTCLVPTCLSYVSTGPPGVAGGTRQLENIRMRLEPDLLFSDNNDISGSANNQDIFMVVYQNVLTFAKKMFDVICCICTKLLIILIFSFSWLCCWLLFYFFYWLFVALQPFFHDSLVHLIFMFLWHPMFFMSCVLLGAFPVVK